jgi:hypothetical protein
MKINGRPVPIVTVELKVAGNGPAAIVAKKEAGTFVDNLAARLTVQPPPSNRDQGNGRLLNIVA